jgi:hypothetical protein
VICILASSRRTLCAITTGHSTVLAPRYSAVSRTAHNARCEDRSLQASQPVLDGAGGAACMVSHPVTSSPVLHDEAPAWMPVDVERAPDKSRANARRDAFSTGCATMTVHTL